MAHVNQLPADSSDDEKFVPGPGFYNVSQDPEPVDLLASDENESWFQTSDGSLIQTQNVENEGDE
jgi:hypothetical protein